MFWDDLRKVLSGPQLYRLDGFIATRLVPIFYALGLAAVGLWAVGHLVGAFAASFSEGLWSILEIVVEGPLMVVALRIMVEVVQVFFAAHAGVVAPGPRPRGRNTLVDEVGDALHDLATDDDGPLTKE
jgi:hypothetical protein